MLIINFLKNTYKLYYSKNSTVIDTLKIAGTEYTMDSNSKKNDGFIGFFDWLRSEENVIKGIRLCFFEHQGYNKLLTKFSYVKTTFEGKCIEILFEGNSFNPSLSGDQDFSNNYVYESKDGRYLFTFGLDHLIEAELNSLLNYCTILNEAELG